MEQINLIEEKRNTRKHLTVEDLKLIYSLYKFENTEDERITKIVKTRNIKEDLSKIYGFDVEEICLASDMICDVDCKLYYGDIKYMAQLFVNDLKFPQVILGNIHFKRTKGVSNVIFPEVVEGHMFIPALEKVENCIPPKILKGCLLIKKLNLLENRSILPEVIEGPIFTAYGIFKTKKELEDYLDSLDQEGIKKR